MKYIIDSWGKIKVQSSKRNLIEIIYNNIVLKFKVSDVWSIEPKPNKIKVNGFEYEVMNASELVATIKSNEQLSLLGKPKNQPVTG